MQGRTISKMGNSFIQFFEETAVKKGNLVKFIKRPDKAKLSAKNFFKVLTLGCLSKVDISLEEMCQLFKQEGIEITKQGLSQRFNAQALALMKGLFTEAMNQFKAK